jgi:hypothetical protein
MSTIQIPHRVIPKDPDAARRIIDDKFRIKGSIVVIAVVLAVTILVLFLI